MKILDLQILKQWQIFGFKL